MPLGIIDSSATLKELMLHMVANNIGQVTIPLPASEHCWYFHIVLLRDAQQSTKLKAFVTEMVAGDE